MGFDVRALLGAAVIACAACSCAPWVTPVPEPTTPAGVRMDYLYVGARPLVPRAWYRDAYEAAAECAGPLLRPEADFDRLRWYSAKAILQVALVEQPQGDPIPTPTGKLFAGVWYMDGSQWLAEDHIDSWDTVYHEMLHEALGTMYGHREDGTTHPEFTRCIYQGRRGAVRIR